MLIVIRYPFIPQEPRHTPRFADIALSAASVAFASSSGAFSSSTVPAIGRYSLPAPLPFFQPHLFLS
jgi:hypothetical protein